MGATKERCTTGLESFFEARKPCPSFPWSFRKYQGKPQKNQGFSSPCEPLKILENKQKTLKKTKENPSKKNTKETKTSRKRRTGKFSRRSGRPRFGSVIRFGDGTVQAVPVFRFRRFLCQKGFSVFQYSLTGKDGSGSWKRVPAVPVPLSVSGKAVPTVPVSGSGSVPEPP